MRIPRRLNRSGYALVLVALSTMAIMASQVSTQGTVELYEMNQVNQRLIDQQLRWFTEGMLRIHQANCIKLGSADPAPANWNAGPHSPSVWFDAGVMDTRSASTRLTITMETLPDAGPPVTRRYRGTTRWTNIVDGSRVTGDHVWSLRNATYGAATFAPPGTLYRE